MMDFNSLIKITCRGLIQLSWLNKNNIMRLIEDIIIRFTSMHSSFGNIHNLGNSQEGEVVFHVVVYCVGWF